LRAPGWREAIQTLDRFGARHFAMTK